MVDRAFFSAAGELLIVPQQGAIRLVTELGLLDAGGVSARDVQLARFIDRIAGG